MMADGEMRADYGLECRGAISQPAFQKLDQRKGEDPESESEDSELDDEDFSEEVNPFSFEPTDCMAIVGDASDFVYKELEPWPEYVTLYQPNCNADLLLMDRAMCFAVQAYLQFCGIPYVLECRSNAESMSPSGKVPFIRCGSFLISEFEGIIAFCNSKGRGILQCESDLGRTKVASLMSTTSSVFTQAEMYISWTCSRDNMMMPAFSKLYPWPLDHIMMYRKKFSDSAVLRATGWCFKTVNKVCEAVSKQCVMLSEKLCCSPCFGVDGPSELDALVYGHLCALLQAPILGPGNKIAETVRNFPNLVDFIDGISTRIFPGHVHEDNPTDQARAKDFHELRLEGNETN